MSDARDVSGVWYGRYASDHPGIESNRFIAVLNEEGGLVAGTITEPDRVTGGLLRADVDGQRTGAQLRFIKQYDGAGRLAHAVRYAGRVDAAGTEVNGGWALESYRGTFTMQREVFDEEELDEVADVEAFIARR